LSNSEVWPQEPCSTQIPRSKFLNRAAHDRGKFLAAPRFSNPAAPKPGQTQTTAIQQSGPTSQVRLSQKQTSKPDPSQNHKPQQAAPQKRTNSHPASQQGGNNIEQNPKTRWLANRQSAAAVGAPIYGPQQTMSNRK
jgi:hypothetical protein